MKNKYLGIDFGDKRVGIAITDFTKEIAFPRDFLLYYNIDQLIQEIKNLCKENFISKVIIGLPIQMDGTMGDRVEKTKFFGDELKKELDDIEVEYFDERLTTKTAISSLHSMGIASKNQKGHRDALSAQIILETYIRKFSI